MTERLSLWLLHSIAQQEIAPPLPLPIPPLWSSEDHTPVLGGFPEVSDGKESTTNAGDLGSIPGSGGFLGEGNGNPLQYSCLENPMDRGA